MFSMDHRPLANTPMTREISSEHNNRYGAVLSALSAFWNSRRVVEEMTGVRDAYSVVLFDHASEVWDLMVVLALLMRVEGPHRG